jgi:lysine 6-dehydrogenase
MVSLLKDSPATTVVNCVEGDWNLNVLKACVAAKKHCVDLGSDIPMTRDQIKMHSELKKKGLTHITGCGSVPGIGNVMLRHAAHGFDKIDSAEVGFNWDSNIKKFVVPFSIQSIIEEFTSPAPIVVNHRISKVNPMDSVVRAYHHEIGREPQFNVGHHPETYTFYRYCKDKGIKTVKFYAGFPKHSFDAINQMIEMGYGEKSPIDYSCGDKIVPIEFLTQVLKRLPIPKGYTEKENLWVELKGKKNGKNKEVLMECIVPTLKGWEDAGCNVDTGMPASIMAQMIHKGIIKERGSFAPEDVVPTEPFFKELSGRSMSVFENGRRIN